MKKTIVMTFFLAALALLIFPAQENEYYSHSYARLSHVVGDVFVQRAPDSENEEGTVNLPLIEGAKLGSEEGRAEIHFGRKNYIRLDHHTQIDLIKLPRKGDDSVVVHLISGSVFLRVSEMDHEKDFAVHTPDASHYILMEGLYSLSVREAGETEFQVWEGAAEAAGEERSLLIEEGQRVLAAGGKFSADPGDLLHAEGDAFLEWNHSRDELFGRHVTASYLPSELDDYETELADNGRWVNERPYGYVWVPHVSVSGWRPYDSGRWVWYPVIGWTWVSYDPWGWCVTHYGRWHWRASLGWYWIPTRRWGPAWVHWYSGVDYIGWCPLSYYGYPAVIIDNHFYGRYYHRYYPLHSRALTVVHRKHLRSRHVSRAALSHWQVSRLGRISLSARQPRGLGLKSGGGHIRAEKVLARSRLRRITDNYPGRSSVVSRARVRSSAAKNKIRGVSSTRSRVSGSRAKSTRIGIGSGSIGRRILSSRGGSASSSIPKYGSRNKVDSRSRLGLPRNSYPARISRSSSRSASSRTRVSGASGLRSGSISKRVPSIRSENRVSSSNRRSINDSRRSRPIRSPSGAVSTSSSRLGSGSTRSSGGNMRAAPRSSVRGSSPARKSGRGVVSRASSLKTRSSTGSRSVYSRSTSRSSRGSGPSIRSRSSSSSRSSTLRRSSSRSSTPRRSSSRSSSRISRRK